MTTWRKAKQDGDAWDPQPGEVLTGELIQERIVNTKLGESSLADIRRDDGVKVSAWLTATSLARQWKDLNPHPGDLVRITYEGKRPGKNYYDGKLAEYHAYVLEVADAEPTKGSNAGKPKRAAPVTARDHTEIDPPPPGDNDRQPGVDDDMAF